MTTGTFNTATGSYSFASTDFDNFPIGIYTFEITASAGTGPTLSVMSTIEMEIYDKCTAKEIDIILNPATFPTAIVEYVLTDNNPDVEFPMLTSDPVRCGVSIDSITTLPVGGEPTFTFEEKDGKVIVKFDYVADLLLAGNYELVFRFVSQTTVALVHKVPLKLLVPCEDS